MQNNLTPIVRNLLIINVLVFIVQSVWNDTQMTYWFGLHYVKGASFMPHQLLTHMFLHGGFTHLLSNMFGLFMFGPLLEALRVGAVLTKTDTVPVTVQVLVRAVTI